MKVCPPDGACVQIEAPSGRTYQVQRDGTFHMDDRDGRAALAGGECFRPGVSMSGAAWRCVCGWLAAINHCPRCDRSDLVRECR